MSSFDLNFPIRTKAALARVKEKHPNRKNTGRKGFSTRKRIKRNASLHKMTHTLFFYFSHRLSVGRVVIVIANQVEDTVDEIEKSFEVRALLLFFGKKEGGFWADENFS